MSLDVSALADTATLLLKVSQLQSSLRGAENSRLLAIEQITLYKREHEVLLERLASFEQSVGATVERIAQAEKVLREREDKLAFWDQSPPKIGDLAHLQRQVYEQAELNSRLTLELLTAEQKFNSTLILKRERISREFEKAEAIKDQLTKVDMLLREKEVELEAVLNQSLSRSRHSKGSGKSNQLRSAVLRNKELLVVAAARNNVAIKDQVDLHSLDSDVGRVWARNNEIQKHAEFNRRYRCISCNNDRNTGPKPRSVQENTPTRDNASNILEALMKEMEPSRFIDEDEIFQDQGIVGYRKRSGTAELRIRSNPYHPETKTKRPPHDPICYSPELPRSGCYYLPERKTSATDKDMTTAEIRQKHLATRFSLLKLD